MTPDCDGPVNVLVDLLDLTDAIGIDRSTASRIAWLSVVLQTIGPHSVLVPSGFVADNAGKAALCNDTSNASRFI